MHPLVSSKLTRCGEYGTVPSAKLAVGSSVPPAHVTVLALGQAATGDANASAQHVWPTWGYNLAEGWREDGFSLAYPLAAKETARAAVVGLAKRFEQGAIFEYAPGPTSDSLVRTTVPALSSSAVEEVVTVWRVPATLPHDTAVDLRRPWAGPKEALPPE